MLYDILKSVDSCSLWLINFFVMCLKIIIIIKVPMFKGMILAHCYLILLELGNITANL